ncbi:hypothetical protein H5410_042636 [Solanum commersonii]|uniref:FAD/NAD(P)-binding domain-containing protein n=1 Tax=Solanum commersonii TaxID=4109 RepID=A0A9J5XWK1_SOLCO|nr:hypothetical protein H5410_042636 [Solanum commersonii]
MISPENRTVSCRSGINDNLAGWNDFYLVVAVGAQVNTFITPGSCFEKSVIPGLSDLERRTNLHFVIVGWGPTGVEFAAELHDYVYEDLVKIYPSVKDFVKITVIQSGDHILNTFDERISSCAEQKFQRDGIEVSTGKHVEVPYGMVVWSTGVGSRSFVKDFMEQVGSVEEFRDVLEDIIICYPQVALYLKNKHLLEAKDLFRDSEGNEREEVDIEDSQMKSLPATAQVAAQQGTYLARCSNRWDQCKSNPEGPRHFKSSGRHKFLPFEYRHLGQFAPFGGDQAAAELPGDWVSMGHSTQWLWYSVYAR